MSDQDDHDLFHQAMQDTRPLDQSHHKPYQPEKKFKKTNQPTEYFHNNREINVIDYSMIDKDNWVDGNKSVSFSRSGISNKTLEQLKSSKLRFDAELDLHHHSGASALAVLSDFIKTCVSHGCRVVRVIHGKGYKSQFDKPILKNLVIDDLHKNLFVLAYHSARPQDGGTGALNILLKAANKVKP